MARSLKTLLLFLPLLSFAFATAKGEDECGQLGRKECKASDACAWIKKECVDAPADACAAFGRRKCRRSAECSWIDKQCVETPAEPAVTCNSLRRRKCKHVDPYSSLCSWDKIAKSCKPLCQSWPDAVAANENATIFGAMINTINLCVPDCIDNPVNQFLPRSADAYYAYPLDEAWPSWGIPIDEVYHRDTWCPAVYGNLVAGKPAYGGFLSPEALGMGRDCDDHHSHGSLLLLNWVWSWNAGLAEYFTGNRNCCETCGTCNTEKFHCATPDVNKGAYPCGSDAWGFRANISSPCFAR